MATFSILTFYDYLDTFFLRDFEISNPAIFGHTDMVFIGKVPQIDRARS
jgi:hypothetical protein